MYILKITTDEKRYHVDSCYYQCFQFEDHAHAAYDGYAVRRCHGTSRIIALELHKCKNPVLLRSESLTDQAFDAEKEFYSALEKQYA